MNFHGESDLCSSADFKFEIIRSFRVFNFNSFVFSMFKFFTTFQNVGNFQRRPNSKFPKDVFFLDEFRFRTFWSRTNSSIPVADEWINPVMEECTDECTDKCTDECMDECTDVHTYVRTYITK